MGANILKQIIVSYRHIEIWWLQRNLNPGSCNTNAMLHKLSYAVTQLGLCVPVKGLLPIIYNLHFKYVHLLHPKVVLAKIHLRIWTP